MPGKSTYLAGHRGVALLNDALLRRLFRAGSGRIAQLVEQMTLNHRVPGSSPGAPTKLFKHLAGFCGFHSDKLWPVIPTKRLVLFARHDAFERRRLAVCECAYVGSCRADRWRPAARSSATERSECTWTERFRFQWRPLLACPSWWLEKICPAAIFQRLAAAVSGQLQSGSQRLHARVARSSLG